MLCRRSRLRGAEEERKQLEVVLRGPKGAKKGAGAAKGEEVTSGVFLTLQAGKITLSGTAVDQALQSELRDWLQSRG